MQTIKINNPEVENIIHSYYGDDETTLLKDFTLFIKFLKDKKEFNDTLKRVQANKEPLYDEDSYNHRMREFKVKLENHQN